MKTLIYSSLIVIFFSSCTAESGDSEITSPSDYAPTAYAKKGFSAANPANPYDHSGAICYEILNLYYAAHKGKYDLATVKMQVEAITDSHAEFQSLIQADYQSPLISTLQDLVADATTDLSTDLSNAGYSTKSKSYLMGVATTLTLLKAGNASYAAVHEYFLQTENAILHDSFSGTEQQALLVTMAELRYMLYHDTKRKRRRDRDWEWSVGNLVATSNYSVQNIPESIIAGITTKLPGE